ncbi:fam-m protein [Plasmodium brasilianum]|uniref:Fam-m protein n=1 Tax=Plasmodium brasilianum TaxID=5824 RepID=A0ACB9YAU3_PLABR|nr:fam-m protein [Plasmodium brasilianum]
MEQKIRIILFIKIYVFVLLIWICRLNNDVNKINTILIENYDFFIKLNTRNYRLLAKCKYGMDSNIVELKSGISNSERVSIGKNKPTNRNLLNKAKYYTEFIDCNNGMFDGKYFHYEKKWIKKKDYDDFIEQNRRVRDIALKKIKFRNYGVVVALFFLFLLLGIGLPILQGQGYLQTAGNFLKTQLGLDSAWNVVEECLGKAKYHFFLISFVILIIILAVIIVITIPKILKNNEKYKKIKVMTE